MKIITAIDSFKGSLSSSNLNEAVQLGIQKVYPESSVLQIAIADGGEGTIEALVEGNKGQLIEISVNNPLMKPVLAKYGIIRDGKVGVIEMATASGLPLIPLDKRDPSKTTTFGTGELIHDAIKKGCREFIIGIGGSATNDGGLGMLQALGYKFLDKDSNELPGCGSSLEEITSINEDNVLKELKECKFLIACDVDNLFYGKNGAAHVFGKQKGANEKMILDLDRGLKTFANTVEKLFNIDINVSGAGGAGGLGGAFLVFLKGVLKPGIEIIMEEVGLVDTIKGADFVITGEGRIDFQSVMGKTPVGVSKLAKKHNIPVIALAGSVSDDAIETHKHGINSVFSIMDSPMSLEEAMNSENTKRLITKKTEEVFRLIKACEQKFTQQ